IFRLDAREGSLRLMTAWAREPSRQGNAVPVFRLGEGIAGRVARDWVPALVNDVDAREEFVPRANPVARLLCVPVTYYDKDREAMAIFGVLNATRRPGAPPFTTNDLE